MSTSITPAIITTFLLLLSSCATTGKIKDFTSDGCTLFPDKSLITGKDWSCCCLRHDIAYWKGGTEEDRLQADRKLKACILKKTGNAELAEMVFQGVRLGGSPYFYNWYRWGYGWKFDRKYQALTPEEEKQAERKLRKYFRKHPGARHPES